MLLLFGGWLALLSAFALLLALAGLFLVDAKHLGTAPGTAGERRNRPRNINAGVTCRGGV